jgi:hypothetical protein
MECRSRAGVAGWMETLVFPYLLVLVWFPYHFPAQSSWRRVYAWERGRARENNAAVRCGAHVECAECADGWRKEWRWEVRVLVQGVCDTFVAETVLAVSVLY